MKTWKSILTAMLLLCILSAAVACDSGGGEGAATSRITNAPTDSSAGTSVQETQSLSSDETSTAEQSQLGGSTATGKSGSTSVSEPAAGKTTGRGTSTTQARTTPKTFVTCPPDLIPTTISRPYASESFIKSLKGFELKILNPWKGPEAGTPVYESSQYVELTVEAMYQVVITEDGFWEGYGDTVAASLAAGKPQAHIYKVQNFNYAGYLSRKYFCDLSSAMRTSKVDMKEPWYNQEARKFLNVNRKQYGWATSDYDPYLIYYNRDKIRAANLTDPIELAEAGTWTWSKLQEYSQKLTTSSCKGLVSSSQSMFLSSLAASNGASLTTLNAHGEPTTNLSNATVKNTLQTLSSWSKTKTVDFLDGGDWMAAKRAFGNGQAAMIHTTADFKTAVSSSLQGKIGVVPFPKGPKANGYTNVVVTNFIDFVPVQYAKDAAKILFIRNEMYRQSYRFRERDFVLNNRSMFSGETLEMLCKLCYAQDGYRVQQDWTSLCELGTSMSTAWIAAEVARQSMTPQQAIDSYGPLLAYEYASVWEGLSITGK